MGKRSDFERRERDFYPTPYDAVVPLLAHLGERVVFAEPCAGDGALVASLERHGHVCHIKSDIDPQDDGILQCDAFHVDLYDDKLDYIITNPPWDRKILHPMIDYFMLRKPTWVLFDADWMHTKQSIAYLDFCSKIVSVGRVKWIPDSKMTGKDNCCWYLFDAYNISQTQFYGRTQKA